jgi:hypothetical protein
MIYSKLLIITIIALLSIDILNINSNFENIFAQNEDSKTPPLIEPDKNITIMAIEKYLSKSIHYY